MTDKTELLPTDKGIVVALESSALFVTAEGAELKKEIAYSRFLEDIGLKPPAEPGIYEWSGRIDYSGCLALDDEPTWYGDFRLIGTVADLEAWNRRPAVEAAPDLTETAKRIAWEMRCRFQYGCHDGQERLWRSLNPLHQEACLSAARAVSAPAAAPGGVEGWTAIPNGVIHGLIVGIEDAIKTFEHGKTRAKTKSDRGSQQLGIYHLESPLHRLKAVIEKQSLSASPAAPAAQSGEGWQPIETAPRDKTEIIVAVPSMARGGHIVSTAYFDPGADGGSWWWGSTSQHDYYSSSIEDGNDGPPTHWMPLPSAPAPREA